MASARAASAATDRAGDLRSSTLPPPVSARRYARHAAARRRVLPARAPPRGPRRLVAPPCALTLATRRGCLPRAAPRPSLLASDRQVLARGGCCIR